ncbi:hypothetical protein [Alkalihalobacillus sp. 1P02AB]|uniref:hypothetical protein n=1 Tax=Alkalihalobacillus sp. 1P02AB TaxID=3132260 RepID=UPI0039A669C0
MKPTKGKIIGAILFLISIGFFTVQIAYFYAHHRFQVEYIDNRLFYVITILCVICLALALFLLLSFSKKQLVIGASIVSSLLLIQIVLLFMSNQDIKNITSISPNFKQVLSLKEDPKTGETVYYRSYFGILGRPIEVLPYETNGEFKVDWLAKDVAAVTYTAADGMLQQFIGTYGERGRGGSYYYVGPEIHGVWQGTGVEVMSTSEGISVIMDGDRELFTWENVFQFGTLAIVLKKDDEAAWTLSLNENFNFHTEASIPASGNITLYEATMDKTVPFVLERIGDYEEN